LAATKPPLRSCSRLLLRLLEFRNLVSQRVDLLVKTAEMLRQPCVAGVARVSSKLGKLDVELGCN